MSSNVRPRTSRHWSRRSLLHTLALGAGGLSYAASARRELAVFAGARAAALAQPKRLLVLWSPNGINESGGGRDWLIPGAGTKDFSFGPITAPLERHRGNLVFFDNMSIITSVDTGDAHGTGRAMSLTGAKMALKPDPAVKGTTAHKSTAPSIDFYVGEKVGRIATPQFPSVAMTLVQKNYPAQASFGVGGSDTPTLDSPWKLYAKLFGNLPANGSAAPVPEVATRLALRKSVLDRVAKDVEAFKKTVPAEDRMRADAQLDAIRTLESRLMPPGAKPGAACRDPMLPTAWDPYDTTKYHLTLRATADTILGAFACDLTRVAFINLRDGGWQDPVNHPPINSPYWEHIMSHDHRDVFVQLKTWYMSDLVAYLGDRLSAIPEGEGTMLDNTIVFWATDISRGHQVGGMPFMTMGGKNLGVNVGNLLRLPTIAQSNPSVTIDGKAPPAKRDRQEKGYPHLKLLISLLHAFGIQEDTFGDSSIATGPMDGYLV